jgi:hypothetical protein
MKMWMWSILLFSVFLAGAGLLKYQMANQPILSVSASASGGNNKVAFSNTISPVAPKAMVAEANPSPPLLLNSVNGILLSDDLSKVREVKGDPLNVLEDPVLKTSQTHLYSDCEIHIRDGVVQSVVVQSSVGKVILDGEIIPFDQLKQRLGTPFFVSEDGLVYRKGNHAFKLFMDENASSIKFISFFHVAGQ